MKIVFIPVCRVKDKDGNLFKDDDGAFYFTPHNHELLKGKEFANTNELITLIQDNKEKFNGEEIILINVISL